MVQSRMGVARWSAASCIPSTSPARAGTKEPKKMRPAEGRALD